VRSVWSSISSLLQRSIGYPERESFDCANCFLLIGARVWKAVLRGRFPIFKGVLSTGHSSAGIVRCGDLVVSLRREADLE